MSFTGDAGLGISFTGDAGLGISFTGDAGFKTSFLGETGSRRECCLVSGREAGLPSRSLISSDSFVADSFVTQVQYHFL
jgi:hypothetical protein